MKTTKLIGALVITALLIGTVSTTAHAARRTNRQGCDVVTRESQNNRPNGTSYCYGTSSIRGDFHRRGDVDWVRHIPMRKGTQWVYVRADGRMKVRLYRGSRVVDTGTSTSKGGWIRLKAQVNPRVKRQNILAVQALGEPGVDYSVHFFGVR